MGMEYECAIVGVDGGGTGCRVVLLNDSGQRLGFASGGPANAFTDPKGAIKNVLAAVQEASSQAGHKIDLRRSVAHVGLAGVLDQEDASGVASAMPFLKTSVSDDRATSLEGALGTSNGVLAAIGTGTIVAAQSDGRVRYFGGWGHRFSDQASGAWLGHHALRCAILAYDGLANESDLTQELLGRFGGTPVTLLRHLQGAGPADYAELAPLVVGAAKAGDATGVALMNKGATYLMSCIQAAEIEDDAHICLSGGVGPHYAPYLDKDFQARVQEPKGNALDGAVSLARNLVGPEVQKR